MSYQKLSLFGRALEFRGTDVHSYSDELFPRTSPRLEAQVWV